MSGEFIFLTPASINKKKTKKQPTNLTLTGTLCCSFAPLPAVTHAVKEDGSNYCRSHAHPCTRPTPNWLTVSSSSNHPYEVAEVISLPIDQGNPPYLKWIGDIVPE